MSDPSMVGSDLFLRHTSTNGKADTRQHRVWDADRFLDARQQECRRLNTEAAQMTPPEPAGAKVELVDRATYERERGRRG